MTAEFADANHALFTHTASPDLRTETIASDQDVYVLEILDFYDAIRHDRPRSIPIREGALSLELALAARRIGRHRGRGAAVEAPCAMKAASTAKNCPPVEAVSMGSPRRGGFHTAGPAHTVLTTD